MSAYQALTCCDALEPQASRHTSVIGASPTTAPEPPAAVLSSGIVLQSHCNRPAIVLQSYCNRTAIVLSSYCLRTAI